MSKSRTLTRESGSEWEHREERVHSTVKERWFQGNEEGEAKRASLEEEEGSMSG